MKRNKNGFLYIIFNLIIVFCAIASATLFGCNDEGKTENPDINVSSDTIYFVDSTISIKRFETVELNVNYGGSSDIIWSSSDNGVAVVKDGVVLANNVGSAEITASVDGESAKCTVVVAPTTSYISLKFGQSEVEIAQTKTKTVYATVVNALNQEVDERFVSYSYTSGDSEIFTVNDSGVLYGNKIGSSTLTVVAEYAGQRLEESIPVAVKENVVFSFDRKSIDLYVDSLGNTFNTQQQLQIFVIENDLQVENPTILWSVDKSDVATVSTDGIVTGVNKGVANVTATYTSLMNTPITASIIVNVDYPTLDALEKLTLEVNAETNSVIDLTDYKSYFNDAISNVKVVDDLGNEIGASLNANKVTVVNSTLSYGFRKLNFIVNSKVRLSFDADIITKFITNASELSRFAVEYGGRDSEKYPSKSGSYEGYFVLANNIDMTGYSINWTKGSSAFTLKKSYGFKGIFDGNGYTVYNASSNIFGKVSEEGIIKNLSVVNNQCNLYGNIAYLFAGSLENVYIHTDTSDGNADTSAICYQTIGKPTFDNVVVEVAGVHPEGKSKALLVYDSSMPANCQNVYVTSPNKVDNICNSGSFSGSVTHYTFNENREYKGLDKTNGFWERHDGGYRFSTSLSYFLNKVTTPDKSTFVLNGNTLTWNTVSNANGYIVLLNGKTYDCPTNSFSNVPDDAVVYVRAKGDGINYQHSDYSEQFVRFNIEEPYLLTFDNEAYTHLVSVDKEYNLFDSLNIEYVEELDGRKGLLHMYGQTSGMAAVYITLPKPIQTDTYLTSQVKASFSAGSVTFGLLRSTQGGWNANNYWSWQGNDTWHTEKHYSIMNPTDNLRFCIGNATDFDVYLSVFMKGDKVDFIKQKDVEIVREKLALTLGANELLSFDSEEYLKLITVDKTYANFKSLDMEILDNYDGKSGVLHISGEANGIACLYIILPTSITTKSTITAQIKTEWSKFYRGGETMVGFLETTEGAWNNAIIWEKPQGNTWVNYSFYERKAGNNVRFAFETNSTFDIYISTVMLGNQVSALG